MPKIGIVRSHIAAVVLIAQLVLPGQVLAQSADPGAGATTPAPPAPPSPPSGALVLSGTDAHVLDAQSLQGVTSLHVAEGAVVVVDFGAAGATGLQLTGDLTNSGTIYAVSSNQAVTTGTFAANNIANNQNALLTTILPTGGIAGLNLNWGSFVGNLSLSLQAVNNIVNAGTISSAGDLTAVAGGSIINALPAGVTGSQPVMQAMNNLNLMSNIGSITNSGLISALTGNLNITTQAATSLLVNNICGRLEAVNGLINVRDSGFAGKFDLSVFGGDIVTRELNLFSGDGIIEVNVNELKGLVNITGGIAHVTANTTGLEIGQVSLTGDPTFYNTHGDITLNSDLSFPGQDLAIIASGNIISNGAQIINTSSNNNGGQITIIAGANIVSNAGLDALPPNGDTQFIITVTGGNSTGGRIDLSFVPIIGMSSVGAHNAGGNINLIAYAGSDPNSGKVSLPTSLTVATGSGGSDLNGNFTVIAGAQSGTAIQVGNVNTQGANNGSGNIYMLTANPTLSGCTGCIGNVQFINGRITAGNFNTDANQYPTTNGSIVAGDLFSRGGSIQLLSGGTLSVGRVTTDGANAAGRNGGIALLAGASSGTAIVANDLLTRGGTVASGNILLITSQPGSPCGTCPLTSRQANTQGAIRLSNVTAAGNIDIRAGGDLSANILTANGVGSVNGGQVGLIVDNSNGSSNPFVVGSSGANGVARINVTAGSKQAGSIGIVSGGAGGITVVDQSALNVIAAAKGNGGSIGLNARNGTLTTSGTWTLNGSIQGAGGFLNLAGKAITFTNDLNISVNGVGTTTGANGGTVTITADTLNLPLTVGTISAAGFGSNGRGGSVTISSSNKTTLGGGLTINASGAGTGAGGNVVLGSNGLLEMGIGSVSLDAGAQNSIGGRVTLFAINTSVGIANLTLNASSTGGSGGMIDFEPGNLTASTGTIVLNANSQSFSGGSITFLADTVNTGSGQLRLNANSADGFGGYISWQSKQFTSGTGAVVASANGGLNGGRIDASIEGYGGLANFTMNANAEGVLSGSGGLISVIAPNAGNSLIVGSQAGQISLNATGYSTTGDTADGGIVSVSTGSNLTVDGSAIRIGTSALDGKGGAVELIAGTSGQGILQLTGALAADGVGTGDGGTISLVYADSRAFNSVDTAGTAVTNAPSISAQALGTGSGGTVTVRNTSSGSPVGLTNNGTITVKSAGGAGGRIEVVAAGSVGAPTQDILIQGSGTFIGKVYAAGRTVSTSLTGASAFDVGAIQAIGGNLNLTAPNVTVDSGAILSSTGTLSLSVSSLTNNANVIAQDTLAVNSTGNLAITGTGTLAGTGVNISSSGGSVNATQNGYVGTVSGSATTDYSIAAQEDSLTVGNLSANRGDLTVVANGGDLILNDQANLIATEGNATIQNASSSGSIVFRPFATVTATSIAGDGKIFVVLGPIPTNPTAGSTPANMTVNATNGGSVYFGVEGISSQCCNQVANSNGSTIIFNADGSTSGQIVLSTNNTLNATNRPTVVVAPLPPGKGGTPPGQGGLPPGLGGIAPPGLGGTPPGLAGTTPGAGNVVPPGQGGTPPGKGGTPPGQAKKLAYAGDETEDSDYVPVAFIQGSASFNSKSLTSDGSLSARTISALIKHTADCDIFANASGAIRMENGEAIIAASKPTIVKSPTCTISIGSGAVVHVTHSASTLKVRNLYDAGRNSVKVMAPSRQLAHSVEAGQELVVSLSGEAFNSMSQDKLGRRKVKETTLAGGANVISAEYSLPSLIATNSLVGRLFNSESQEDKALAQKISKLSVCLSTVTASHGVFTRLSKP